MKRSSIKWRIFKYNLIVVVPLMILVIIIFNVSVRIYIQREIVDQLKIIASHTEEKALIHGPDFFPRPNDKNNPRPPMPFHVKNSKDDMFHFYFILDQSLGESLSVLNANYMLFDNKLSRLNPLPEDYNRVPKDLVTKITEELAKVKNNTTENYFDFNLSSNQYVAIIKPVSQKNNFGLGWIVIYSSLQKVNQLKLVINFILIIILFVSSLFIVLFSSITAKRISAPLSSLNTHIKELSQRNFSSLDKIPEEDELRSLVDNINLMSAKLSEYDKAQKTFLQNASHELRTPLMSIQSYAEGIKYEVVDPIPSSDIIIGEAKRLTSLVEDLLYLSRLDTIQESYQFEKNSINEVLYLCYDRMKGIALSKNIELINIIPEQVFFVQADQEKLSRAITNIMTNCIRYAKTTVTIKLSTYTPHMCKISIYDDGTGFDNDELPIIFDRFYKGKKGNFGLGLAITQNIIEKHNGNIKAENGIIGENSSIGAYFTILLPIIN